MLIGKKRKKMSKTSIPVRVRRELWFRAAGRCEFKGCNEPLDRHGITMDSCDCSECAHIIADSVDGPRGDAKLSKELAQDINNIMLMCPKCHKYIDNEGAEKYDEQALRAMKIHHEERMRMLTGIPEDNKALPVTFGSAIGDSIPIFNFNQLSSAMIPEYYPSKETAHHLGGDWFHGNDWNGYWMREIDEIEYKCKSLLTEIGRSEHKRIALFGFAPMPSLIKLGTILNSKYEVEVYQKQRRGGWAWPEKDKHIDFKFEKVQNGNDGAVLVLSLSFAILPRIIESRKNSTIWHFTIDKPSPEFLSAKSILYDFGRCVENALDAISKECPEAPIDLYLSVPVACAIELGRVWMQKANSTIRIYEFDRRHDEIDKLAITINN